MNLFKGKKLFWVANNNARIQADVTVLSIGRKWASLSNRERIDIKTLEADGRGYSSPGKCYESREAYELSIETQKAWSKLYNGLTWALPSGMTLEKINEIRSILSL